MLRSATVVVDGSTLDYPLLLDIDSSAWHLSGGADVTLSGVEDYFNDSVRSLRAEGTGSVLSLPNLETISSSLGQYVTTRFEALGGGTVQIGSEVSQTHSSGSVQFIADGGSESITSVLDVTNLTQFEGYFNNSISGFFSSDGGNIRVGTSVQKTNVSSANVEVDVVSQIETHSFSTGDFVTVRGDGAIRGDLVGNAQIEPGSPQGGLSVVGAFHQATGGHLVVEIASSEFDHLVVDGRASLSGSLEVIPTDGFIPTVGQEFHILEAAGIDGVFTEVTGTTFGDGVKLQPESRADGLFLVAVPDLGPKVIGILPADDARHEFSFIEVSFDEPINFESLDRTDVVLEGPGGSIEIENLIGTSSTSFRIEFATQTAPGDYSIAVGPQIEDEAGNSMDQDSDGNGGLAMDVYAGTVTLTVPENPVVSSQSPSGLETTPPTSLTLQWSVPLLAGSAEDAENFTLTHLGPDQRVGGGDDLIVPVVSNYDEATRSTTLQTTDVAFVLPDGHYQLTVRSGPSGVRNAAGGQLDGNDDGLPGDDYVGSFRVRSQVAAATLRLDSASDSGVFADDGLTNISDPVFEATVNQIGVLEFDADGNGTFEETVFASEPGTYLFETSYQGDGVHHPGIRFWPSIGSRVFVSHSFELDREPPTFVPGAATEQAPVLFREVRFSESVTHSDGGTASGPLDLLLEGPSDQSIDLRGVIGSEEVYELSFAPLSVDGHYVLTSNLEIYDRAGNRMADPLNDPFEVLGDTVAPVVSDVFPLGQTNLDIESVFVEFSEPMDFDSLTVSRVQIRSPDSAPEVSVVGVQRVESSDERFEFVLSETLRVTGQYTVTLDREISDLSGNKLGSSYSAGWTIDKTGAQITSAAPSGVLERVVDFVDVTFDSPIDASTFDSGDVSVIGPEGPVPVGRPVRFSPTTFRVPIAPQRGNGPYTLRVDPDVRDLAGNPLDQNGNGVAGEADDGFTHSFTVSLPNLSVLETPTLTDPSEVPLAEADLGTIFHVAWSVENDGTAAAFGEIRDRVYLSADEILSLDDLSLGEVLRSEADRLSVGESYEVSTSVMIALDDGIEPGDYFILVRSDASGALVEANETDNVASVAIELTYPPLPNLVVSDVAGFEEAIAGQPIELSWNIANIGDAEAVGPWIERVFLANDVDSSQGQLLATWSRSETLAAGQSASRSEVVTIPTQSLNGDVYFVVEVDAGEAVFESNESNRFASVESISIPSRLDLDLEENLVVEGGSRIRGTLTRNGDVSLPLIVDLTASVPEQVELPSTVTIPAGQHSARFFIAAIDESIADANLTIALTANATDFPPTSGVIEVINDDLASLGVTFETNRISEGGVVEGTVTKEFPAETDTIVQLSADDPEQLEIPASVVIPAGETEASFNVLAIDDSWVEHVTQSFVFAVAANHESSHTEILIEESDLVVLSIELPGRVSEGSDGAGFFANLSRSLVSDQSVDVELVSSDPSLLQVPSTVTLPAGQAAITLPFSITDDEFVNDIRSVSITASVLPSLGGLPFDAGSANATTEVFDDDGPAIAVTLQRGTVAEGRSVLATVSRNTSDVSEAVVISLNADQAEEIHFPETVTIEAGQSSAVFELTGVRDAVSDGDQMVTVTADADGFASGVAILLVEDGTLPDLVVSSLQTARPNAATNEDVNVNWALQNDGFAPAQGSWTQRVFLSDDAMIGNDLLVRQFSYDGPLGLGQSYERSAPIRMPNEAGEYWVVIETDVANTVQEGLESNNVRISAEPIVVELAYSASVSTDVEIAPADTSVALSGSANLSDGSPARWKEVSVHVEVRGTKRVLPAITNADGEFDVLFTPLPGEGGQYSVAASHPGDRNPVPQDFFQLVGMRAEPASQQIRVQEGAEAASGELLLRNLADLPLSDLIIEVVDVPEHLVVVADLVGSDLVGDSETIEALGTRRLAYTVMATDASSRFVEFAIRVRSDEAPPVTIPIGVEVVPLVSRLVSNPTRLAAGMPVGGQTSVEFTITNQGGLETGELHVLLPDNADWLTLATGAELDSLAPGESAPVTLLLTPPIDLDLTAYDGGLIVRGSDSEISIPFRFRAVSESVADLRIAVTDEFYYFTDEQPLVQNATVRLLDAITGEEIARSSPTSGGEGESIPEGEATSFTDSEGRITFTGIPEGPYTLEVSSEDHETYRNSIRVEAGALNQQEVFISRNLVQYTWTVEEIEIEDRTRITIEAEFETNVPAPVVTVDGHIDLAGLTVIGQTQQFDFRVTNHGLIQAEDVALEFGSHPYYEIIPLVDVIGVLPAKSELTIPVMVTRIGGLAAGGPGEGESVPVPCAIEARLVWSYDCGRTIIKFAPLAVLNVGGDCTREFSPVPPRPVSIGDGERTEGGPPSVVPVAVSGTDICDFCLDFDLGTFDATPWLKPAEIAIEKYVEFQVPPLLGRFDVTLEAEASVALCCTEDDEQGFSVDGRVFGEAAAGWSDAQEFGPDYSFTVSEELGISIDVSAKLSYEYAVQVFTNATGTIEKECDGEFCGTAEVGVGFRTNASAEIEGTAKFNLGGNIEDSRKFLKDNYGIDLAEPSLALLDVRGNVELQGPSASATIGYDFCEDRLTGNLCFDGVFLAGSFEIQFGGKTIATRQIDELFGENDPDDRYYLIDKYCLFDEPEEDENKNPGQHRYSKSEDVPSAKLGVEYDYARIANDLVSVAASMGAGDGVCASVKLEISQEAILTRSAFRASLGLLNQSANDSLEDLFVEVFVFDESGRNVSDWFSIEAPVYDEIGVVNGLGVLGPNREGSVSWQLVPSSEAALSSPTRYFVGGAMSYRLGADRVEVDLIAVPITVRPQAELSLNYFLQRDVIGDDPHTFEVEPSEPFTLAVQVRNDGAGEASNLQIESAQPRIVENEKGLLVDFTITGARVNGEEKKRTLTAEFGNIEPGEIAVAEWELESTLQGLFVNYDATFEHVSSLGDNRFSLIRDVQIHELIQTVDAAPGASADGLPDFLVNDLPDPQDLPDTLYLSDGSVEIVQLGIVQDIDPPPTLSDLRIDVSVTMDDDGWSYLHFEDPSAGSMTLIGVERPDGTMLPPENFWQTDRTFVGGGLRPVLEDKLHLLDFAGPDRYTLIFNNGDRIGPSVVAFGGVTPNPTTQAVDSVVVEFDEPLSVGTFTDDDFQLLRNGEPIETIGLTISSLGDGAFEVAGLSAYTSQDAVYEWIVDAAGVTDLVGNVGGESASYRWVKGEAAPTILDLSGIESGRSNELHRFLEIEFSKPILASSFSADDVMLVRNGVEVTDLELQVSQVGERNYQVDILDERIEMDGDYRLTVAATGITDIDGLAGVGDAQTEWTLDRTAPVLIEVIEPATNPRNIVVQHLDIRFSESIDVGSLGVDDLSLTRVGSPGNLLEGDRRVTFEDRGDGVYRIGGLNWVQAFVAQPQVAEFQFSIDGNGVRDLAGNPAGEVHTAAWIIDLDAPNPPSDLRLSTIYGPVVDGRVPLREAIIHVTLSEPGLTVAIESLTSGDTLVRQRIDTTDLQLPIEFSGDGRQRLLVRVIDAAGNISETLIEDLFVEITPPWVDSVQGIPDRYTNTSLGDVTLRLLAPVDPASVDVNQISLIQDDSSNLIDESVSIEVHSNGLAFTIHGLETLTSSEGRYQLDLDLRNLRGLSGNTLSERRRFNWVHDASPPESHVRTLAPTQSLPTFVIMVEGTDPGLNDGLVGSGIDSYDLFVSEDGGAFEWFETLEATSSSTTFTGSQNRSYEFYSRARDTAGNVESTLGIADAETTIPRLGPAIESSRIQGPVISRSSVDEIEVLFVGQTNLQDLITDRRISSVFTLTHLGMDGNAGSPATIPTRSSQFRYDVDESTGIGQLTWSLDSFQGMTDSLEDGIYRVELDADALTDLAGFSLDGDGDGRSGGSYRFEFHRLAGDVDGNGIVGPSDAHFVVERIGARVGDAAWNVDADVDRDGEITVLDRDLVLESLDELIVPELPTPLPTDELTRFDVGRDGLVTPLDALLVLNQLRRMSSEHVDDGSAPLPDGVARFDVTRDGEISPLDALQVINQIRRRRQHLQTQAEGEFAQQRLIQTQHMIHDGAIAAVDALVGETYPQRTRVDWLELLAQDRLVMLGNS
ncbi:MAG: Ig-like domain-containing protein [Planctomycetota bacterium]